MEFLESLISYGIGAAIATGIMSIVLYKIKRNDTKEDKEDAQSQDIRELKESLVDVRKEIAELRQYHEDDMETTREEEAEEWRTIKDELCILSYAMLAALSGLKQQGCNGDVTEAYSMLEKHLNKQAHGKR